MVYHYVYNSTREVGAWQLPLQPLAMHGYLGVHLFFIISGFVIVWSAAGRTAGSFARARVLRLYPEFWVALAISAAVFLLIPGGFGDELTSKDIALNFTMVPNYLGASFVDNVYWTLAVEIKFYFLAWLMLILGQLPRIEFWLICWLSALGISEFVETGAVVKSAIIFPYGALFAAGGVFYLVHSSGWNVRRAMALTFALALSGKLALGGMSGFVSPADITAQTQLATVGVVVGIFALIGLAVRWSGSLHGLLTVAATAGSLTYPLYLLHNTGKEIFLRDTPWGRTFVAFLVAASYSLVVSYIVMRIGTGTVRSKLSQILRHIPMLRNADGRGSSRTPAVLGADLDRTGDRVQ